MQTDNFDRRRVASRLHYTTQEHGNIADIAGLEYWRRLIVIRSATVGFQNQEYITTTYTDYVKREIHIWTDNINVEN